jgi:hypothetical protein
MYGQSAAFIDAVRPIAEIKPSHRPTSTTQARKSWSTVPSTGLEPVAYRLGDSVRPSRMCAHVR